MSSLTKGRVPKEELKALSSCNATSAPSLLITTINLRNTWHQPMTPVWVSQPLLKPCGKAARPAGPQCLCPSHSHLLGKRCKQSAPRHLMFLFPAQEGHLVTHPKPAATVSLLPAPLYNRAEKDEAHFYQIPRAEYL